MTYCVGALIESGLVLASDTRTNAGVDHVATVRKMHVFEKPGDRVLVLLSAGNLAITQAVVNLLNEAVKQGYETDNLMMAPTLFRAARIVGEALREVHRVDADHLKLHQTDFVASLILGGQIRGEEPRLFNIYAAGNFIEATVDTPYFQIGEMKYGKPVLDRLISSDMSLGECAKCVLVSYSSTMRSNISVGLPIDLLCYRKDSLRVEHRITLDRDDPYFNALREGWSEALQRAFSDLPDLDLAKRRTAAES